MPLASGKEHGMGNGKRNEIRTRQGRTARSCQTNRGENWLEITNRNEVALRRRAGYLPRSEGAGTRNEGRCTE
jgi:hypothetical protein